MATGGGDKGEGSDEGKAPRPESRKAGRPPEFDRESIRSIRWAFKISPAMGAWVEEERERLEMTKTEFFDLLVRNYANTKKIRRPLPPR